MLFKKMVEPYFLPEVEIIVDDSLGFTVKVFGSYLVDDRPLPQISPHNVQCDFVKFSKGLRKL